MTPDDARGFAGLTSFVSDIAPDLADADRLRRGTPLTAGLAAPEPPRRPPTVAAPPPRGMSRRAKVALGVGGLVVTLVIIGTLAPRQPPQPGPPLPNATHPRAIEPPPRPAPPARPPVRSSTPVSPIDFGTKPPIGDGFVLTSAQLRYCLAEKIRLATVDPLVDPKIEREVHRFNDRVGDFNKRCAHSKYRVDTFEGIRREVEAQRVVIEDLARKQWRTGE